LTTHLAKLISLGRENREIEQGEIRSGEVKAFVAMVLAVGIGIPSFGQERPRVSPVISDQEKQQAWAPPSLAEEYLSQLAKKLGTRRKITGGVLAGAGGAMAVLGGVVLSRPEEDEWSRFFETLGGIGLLGGGVFFASTGAIILAVPTGAERENKRTGAIPDSAEREKAATDALAGLAKRGRRNRMIRGGVFSGLAVLGATSEAKGNIGVTVLCGAAALANFLGKSAEEKTYYAFSENSGVKPAPELVIGLRPRGGISVGFSLDF
jgi:hypothetical protein